MSRYTNDWSRERPPPKQQQQQTAASRTTAAPTNNDKKAWPRGAAIPHHNGSWRSNVNRSANTMSSTQSRNNNNNSYRDPWKRGGNGGGGAGPSDQKSKQGPPRLKQETPISQQRSNNKKNENPWNNNKKSTAIVVGSGSQSEKPILAKVMQETAQEKTIAKPENSGAAAAAPSVNNPWKIIIGQNQSEQKALTTIMKAEIANKGAVQEKTVMMKQENSAAASTAKSNTIKNPWKRDHQSVGPKQEQSFTIKTETASGVAAVKTKATTTAPNQSPPKKRAKKPKPNQRVLTLGDLIVDSAPASKRRSQPTQQATHDPTPAAAATVVDKGTNTTVPRKTAKVSSHLDTNDFPALAAAPSTTTTKPAPTPKPRKQQQQTNSVTKKSWAPIRQQSVGNNGKQKPPPLKSKSKPIATKGLAQTTKHAIILDQSLHEIPSRRDGTEHDLMRFMLQQDGKKSGGELFKKGRQRIRPRRKKFTTLKKKVLQERLDKWNQANPKQQETVIKAKTTTNDATGQEESKSFCIVCLFGFASPEEVEDEDEYQELLENLTAMATKIGTTVADVFIDKHSAANESFYPAFVVFESSRDADAACSCWNGLSLGTQCLEAKLVPCPMPTTQSLNDDNARDEWRQSIITAAVSTENRIESPVGASTQQQPTTIALENILTDDDMEDEDELNESLADVRTMAEECGVVMQVQANPDGIVLITFDTPTSATKAVEKFSGTVIGGQIVSAKMHSETKPEAVVSIVLENILTSDDFEDEDALEESLADVRTMAQEFGTVVDCQADKENSTIIVTYEEEAVANRALEGFSGMVIGGQSVSARLNNSDTQQQRTSTHSISSPSSWIVLNNVLTEEDVEDDDCLEETKNDLSDLASHYGKVLSVVVDVQDGGQIRIQYEGDYSVASLAASKFDGMVIGGQTISAMALSEVKDNTKVDTTEATATAETEGNDKVASPEPTPMFSGDKLIPERFAECKRVPKIPNPVAGPRHYAILTNNEKVKPLLVEMLGELMRLQKRAMEDKNAKARRRIVMGLREVARGIRAHKVKMVAMANNLDKYGVIDEKLQSILDLARQEDVPVFFEFSKKTLGKALGKSIKVAVAGIQNAEGAHQQFKKLVALAPSYT